MRGRLNQKELGCLFSLVAMIAGGLSSDDGVSELNV